MTCKPVCGVLADEPNSAACTFAPRERRAAAASWNKEGASGVVNVASLGKALGCASSFIEPANRNGLDVTMDLERLVDELWCGNHGLGDVSRFLLRALGSDESAAREEFSKFLEGKLSDRLIKLSRLAVETDAKVQTHGRLHRHIGSLRARRQQTTSPTRFLGRGGHDRAPKTAATPAAPVPIRAREEIATS